MIIMKFMKHHLEEGDWLQRLSQSTSKLKIICLKTHSFNQLKVHHQYMVDYDERIVLHQ